MKRAAFIIIATILILVMAGAIYYMQLNFAPEIASPKPPPLPSPNAYDYFLAASKLAYFGENDEVDGLGRSTLALRKQILRRNQPAIIEARKGFSFPYINPGTQRIPGMKEFDDADVFGFASKVYAQEGNWGESARCALDAVQLGQQVMHGGSVSTVFHGERCESLGLVHLGVSIDHLNRSQTKAAIARLGSILSDGIPMTTVFAQVKTDDQQGLKKVFVHPSWRQQYSPTVYLSSDHTIYTDTMEFDDQWIAKARRPYAARLPLPVVPSDAYLQQENGGSPAFGGSTAGVGGMLNWNQMFEWFEYANTQARAALVQTMLGLHAYKLDHGTYPESLAQLTPAYLNTLPADPFALSGPLKYRRVGKTYTLYSIGPDGKDDGGKPIDQLLVMDGKAYPPPSHRIIDMDSKGDIVAGVNEW